MKKLVDEPSVWNKEIQSSFYEQFPFFIKYPLMVDLLKKDTKKGYALGRIRVNNEFIVPVIIEDFILKDFDVAIVKGNTVPLTTESILSMFSNKSAFIGVDDKNKSYEMDRLFNPPLRYPEDTNSGFNYGNKDVFAELIPNLIPTITKEAQDRIINFYSPQDIASFVCNNTEAPLKAILIADPIKDPDLFKVASDNIPRDRQYIHKLARDKYKLYQGNSEIDDTIILEINESEFESLEPKFAKRKEIPEEKESTLVIKQSEVKIGNQGILSDGETHLHIDILHDSVYDGERIIDGLGNNLNIITATVAPVRSIMKTAENSYLIPIDFKFYKLGLSEGVKIGVDKSNSVYKDPSNRYTFVGPVFEKYAENKHKIFNLELADAVWTATQCGSSAEDIVKLGSMRKSTKLYFPYSNLKCPIPLKDFVEKWAEFNEQEKIELDIIYSNLPALLKIATQLDEEKVVDKILALGVINDKNLREFIDALPMFDAVASYLAKLLLMVRLGERSVPERDVEEAMEALSRVTMHLRNISEAKKNTKELKS